MQSSKLKNQFINNKFSKKTSTTLHFTLYTLNFTFGFSLVEILLVIAGIGFLVILMATLPNSVNLITRSRYQSLAKEIAVKQIETVREQSYANLALGTQNLTDQRISFLPSGSGVKEVEDCNPQICKQAELVKKVTVTIDWTQEGLNKQIKLVTFVSDGGLNK